MNKTFLTAVSAIALMAAAPAMAADNQSPAAPGSAEAAQQSTGSFTKDVKKAWKNTKQDASKAADTVSDKAVNAWDSTKEGAKDAYTDAKQALHDDDNHASVEKLSVNTRITAKGMLGQPVYNTDGDRVAKVRDIILDDQGNAQMVILGDGNFTGLGKMVALDYDVITKRNSDGDVIAALTEEMIDSAASFSYQSEGRDGDAVIIPPNGYSVSELLDGEVVGPNGQSLASVDNIVFRNGHADQLVVAYDQTLGLGGKLAAIAYGDADPMRKGDKVNFELSANEAADFDQFKNTATN